MADFYGSDQEQSWFNDAEAPSQPNNNAPINTQASPQGGTLPPVVQPFVVVPYVSQMQPLYQYDYSNYMHPQQEQIDVYETAKPKSKVYVTKIFAIIFAILSIAVIVIGKFINLSTISVLGLNLSILNIYGANSGLSIIMTIPTVLKAKVIYDMIVAFGMAAVALCAVLNLIVNVLTINRKTKVLKRVLAALQVIFVAAVFFALFKTVGFSEIKYGLYILAALGILSIF